MWIRTFESTLNTFSTVVPCCMLALIREYSFGYAHSGVMPTHKYGTVEGHENNESCDLGGNAFNMEILSRCCSVALTGLLLC